jgi:hypothetical protein
MKAGLVAERGLGGVFLWALDLDDFQSGYLPMAALLNSAYFYRPQAACTLSPTIHL